jgi:hypothetical protein
MQDKKAFDRARAEFAKRTSTLNDDELAADVQKIVEETRTSPPPILKLTGVTFATSSEAGSSPVSSTLTF